MVLPESQRVSPFLQVP
ncbi:unnamed protein product, partial [Didymodactylos carnosus]